MMITSQARWSVGDLVLRYSLVKILHKADLDDYEDSVDGRN